MMSDFPIRGLPSSPLFGKWRQGDKQKENRTNNSHCGKKGNGINKGSLLRQPDITCSAGLDNDEAWDDFLLLLPAPPSAVGSGKNINQ